MGHSLIPRGYCKFTRPNICKRKISVCEGFRCNKYERRERGYIGNTLLPPSGGESFRIFGRECQRDYGGNSIMRDINERGEDNFAAVAADAAVGCETLHHPADSLGTAFSTPLGNLA